MTRAQPPRPSNEADLLALRAERDSMRAEINALADDDEASRRIGGLVDLEVAIVSATATTFTDALVQLEQLVQWSADASGRVPNRTEKALGSLLARLKTKLDRSAPVPPQADAELLTLKARLIEEEEQYERLDKSNEPRSTLEKANEAAEGTEQRLIDIPAQGMMGVNVKLDHALSCMNPDPRDAPFNDLDWGPQILVRVYEDVARLAAEPDAEPPVSVFALEAEMIRQRDIANSGVEDNDATLNKHGGVMFDLIEQIASTQAKTLPDLAAQARTLEYILVTWGSDWDGFKDFARVVREGAERMAGAS